MATVTVTLKSTAPYSQSKAYVSEKDPNESYPDFEARCWHEHLHIDGKDNVYIPARAFQEALLAAAAFNGKKIKGRGNATYAVRFQRGVRPDGAGMVIGKPADFRREVIWAHAQPSNRKKSPRVYRSYPTIDEWQGTMKFWVTDPLITKDIFVEMLKEAGCHNGVGRYRVENGGLYGCWEIAENGVKWES